MDFSAKDISQWLWRNATEPRQFRNSAFDHWTDDYEAMTASELLCLVIEGSDDQARLARLTLRDRIQGHLYEVDVINSTRDEL